MEKDSERGRQREAEREGEKSNTKSVWGMKRGKESGMCVRVCVCVHVKRVNVRFVKVRWSRPKIVVSKSLEYIAQSAKPESMA